jgi:hypothetical protein
VYGASLTLQIRSGHGLEAAAKHVSSRLLNLDVSYHLAERKLAQTPVIKTTT